MKAPPVALSSPATIVLRTASVDPEEPLLTWIGGIEYEFPNYVATLIRYYAHHLSRRTGERGFRWSVGRRHIRAVVVRT